MKKKIVDLRTIILFAFWLFLTNLGCISINQAHKVDNLDVYVLVPRKMSRDSGFLHIYVRETVLKESRVKYYYIFHPNKVSKTDNTIFSKSQTRQIGLPVYKSVSLKDFEEPLSSLDKQIFIKAIEVTDSLSLIKLDYLLDVTGFVFEKYYKKGRN